MILSFQHRSLPLLALSWLAAAAPALAQTRASDDLSQQVEILRTEHGVPHIRAQNLTAAGYALAWVQLEDYGPKVATGLLRGRGEMARWFGHDSIESDFVEQRAYRTAIARYPDLDEATRQVYEGFASGANRYIALHPADFPTGFAPHFTGYDVAARDVTQATSAQARRFLARMNPSAAPRGRRGQAATDPGEGDGVDPVEEGSNAWAFAPSRTKSGKAILLRNPHLNWNSGYYEAHMTVPGVLDFYGDFRIGGPFGVVGGFNRDLGWATTNNAPDLEEIYALDVDPAQPDHYLFEGTSIPLEREIVRVAYRNGDGISTESREMWRTPLGPVILRDNGKVYIVRAAEEGDYRGGEQFLRMMRSHSLAEWKDAMRMRARVTSSFTYADRAGNIYYLWNGSAPAFPRPSGGDSAAVPAHSTADVWTHYVPFDSLPQLLNPKGGYIQNENSSPWFTNLHQIIDWTKYPAYLPEPSLSLRSQMALTLIDTKQKLSLEDVIRLKHSYRMLLADRVKDDLVAAVRGSTPSPAVTEAIAMLAAWDNTAAPDSRGGILFETWWHDYTQGVNPDSMYAQPWTPSQPATTPRGLKDPARAAQAFAQAVDETTKQYGRYDIPWGDVHRVRMGSVDVPVGGCAGALGCFRVLNFRTDPDGKREAYGGDGWVLAVEFDDQPRAYSVLAYGESSLDSSPYHSDQAAMFAKGEMKRVDFLPKDVDAGTVKRYRPGAAE
ncbi:MAG: penicillin acylase family protein [Gemmatimonadales bacterium]